MRSNIINCKLAINHKYFEYFVIFTILVASLVTGLRTYELSSSILKQVLLIDSIITIWFVIEVSLRVLTAKNKKIFFLNGWNIFDIIVISLLLFPIEGGDLAAFGRVVRILRILRLLSIVPELRLLTNAFLRSLPQLSYVMMMMFVIFYIYGAIGTTFFSEINSVLWGDIGTSMLTLFRIMTFEDWTDVMYETMITYPNSSFYYISFIFITAFATLNMVIGIMTSSLESEQSDLVQDENKKEFDDINKKLDSLQQLLNKKLDN